MEEALSIKWRIKKFSFEEINERLEQNNEDLVFVVFQTQLQ